MSGRLASLNRIWFTKRSDGVEDVAPKKEEVIVRSMVTEEEEDGTWKEVKEFASNHVVECSAFATLILFGIFCVFNAFGFLGPSDLKIRSAHYEQFFMNLCQFPQNLEGTEGVTEHPNATLVSILAVVRHGQKYGLGNEKCQELSEEEKKLYDEYLEVVKKTKKMIVKPSEVVELEKLPENAGCKNGVLTPIGEIQGFQVGRYLHQKYTALFKPSLLVNISVSPQQRNVASGVSLLAGLLQNFTIPSPIEMKVASWYNGCTDKECECGAETFDRVYDLAKNERSGLFRLQGSRHMRRIGEYIAVNLTKGMVVQDPNELMAYLVSSDICFKKNLPCEGDNCVTWNFMGDMYEYSLSRATKMFELDMGVDRQHSVLDAYPILRYLTLMTERNTREIQLFSSHDSIIASILKVLTATGKFVDLQLYASRIVFEVHEVNGKSKMLRVLHDGSDITSSLPFCTDLEHGLCGAAEFEHFVKKGIFDLVGYPNFNETCRGPKFPVV